MRTGKGFTPDNVKERASGLLAANRRFFVWLRRKKPKTLDQTVQGLHDEVFEYIDCLQCANCCRGLGPLLNERDIERLSKHLKMKPSDFTAQYLRIDDEGDYVFASMPCPFLLPDHYCMVYEHRPKACREYPHTDRKRFHQILDLTLKNSQTCPAVPEIIEKLKEIYAYKE